MQHLLSIVYVYVFGLLKCLIKNEKPAIRKGLRLALILYFVFSVQRIFIEISRAVTE